MKNSWLIWFIVVGVVITVLVAFNYQDEQGTIPLSEIFPEEEDYPVNIEYEFVDDGTSKQPKIVQKTSSPSAVKPAVAAAKPVEKVIQKKDAVPEVVQQVGAIKAEAIPLAKAHYSIQVASFKTKDRAELKASELAKKELDAFVLSRDLAERGTWYRVYVGKFNSKDEAGTYLTNVKKVASDSFVISLK